MEYNGILIFPITAAGFLPSTLGPSASSSSSSFSLLRILASFIPSFLACFLSSLPCLLAFFPSILPSFVPLFASSLFWCKLHPRYASIVLFIQVCTPWQADQLLNQSTPHYLCQCVAVHRLLSPQKIAGGSWVRLKTQKSTRKTRGHTLLLAAFLPRLDSGNASMDLGFTTTVIGLTEAFLCCVSLSSLRATGKLRLRHHRLWRHWVCRDSLTRNQARLLKNDQRIMTRYPDSEPIHQFGHVLSATRNAHLMLFKSRDLYFKSVNQLLALCSNQVWAQVWCLFPDHDFMPYTKTNQLPSLSLSVWFD